MGLLGAGPWSASPGPTANPSPQDWRRTAHSPAGDERPSCFGSSPPPDFIRIFHFLQIQLGWCGISLVLYMCIFLSIDAYHFYICLLATWLPFLKVLVSYCPFLYWVCLLFSLRIHKISLNIQNTDFFCFVNRVQNQDPRGRFFFPPKWVLCF